MQLKKTVILFEKILILANGHMDPKMKKVKRKKTP